MFEAQISYAENALQPVLSSETVHFHYGKHHNGYATNLNQLIKGTNFEGCDLKEIISESRGKNAKIFNNAAQLFNHDFYWKCLKVSNVLPAGLLKNLIDKQFGSIDKFKNEYINVAGTLFGSGWSWLVLEKDHLKFLNTSNAETPIGTSDIPLCVVDLWEHAYYIDYRNNRADYVTKIVNSCIDWNFCESQLNMVG